MRILFLTFSPGGFNPPDVLWYRSARIALTKGHKVWLGLYDWGRNNPKQYTALETLGAQIDYRSPGIISENYWVRQIQRAKCKLPINFTGYWRRLAQKSQPDIIVINDPGLCSFIDMPGTYEWLINNDIPIITICHGIEECGALSFNSYRLARPIFEKAAASIFVSRRNLELARRQLCLPIERGIVLDNPPSFENMSPLPFPSDSEFKMAMVSRLDCRRKGQDIVLDILSRPEWRGRNWSLTIAGNGPDTTYLQDLVRYFNLEDRVRMTGYCDDIQSLWARHAIFILCSPFEGKPLALTEAMCCGRPGIVTDAGGNAELIEDEITGFVAESATLKSFARAMERAWERRAHWERMGALAHRNIWSRFEVLPEQQLLGIIESISKSEYF